MKFNRRVSAAVAVTVLLAGVAYAAQDVEIMGSDGTVARKVKVASDGALVTGGPVADDAAASGNPVPVGGIYNSTKPTYANGDRTQLQSGSRGGLNVNVFGTDNSQGAAVLATQPDGTAFQPGLSVVNHPWLFNGSTNDRARSVINATDSTGTGIAAVGLVGQCDETSPTAATENQFGNLTRNCATGALKVERDGDLFLNIVLAAPTTTTVKSGAGRFHKLCINKPTATGVITMYDNTAASGTLIGTITQPAALLSSGPICIAYDLTFGTGLTIVTATAAQDVTVTYR